MITYHPLHLHIARQDEGYHLRLESPAGQAGAPFVLPFTPEEIAFFADGDWTAAGPDLTLQSAGKRLFSALFQGTCGERYRASLIQIEPNGLRLNLRLTEVPELADLPWESLWDPQLGDFVAASNRTPIVRFLDLPLPSSPLTVSPPLRILALLASPQDLQPLQIDDEWNRIQTALQPLKEAGDVVLERLSVPTLAALQSRLRQDPVHVLHFVGHAGFDPIQNRGYLALQDEEGNAQLIGADQLTPVVGDHAHLRLVYLNACAGARSGHRDSFAGLAQRLVQSGVPCVVGMVQSVADGRSARLAHEFYAALADGYAVDTAHAEVCKFWVSQEGGLTGALPVLFSRSLDNRLLPAPELPPAAALATRQPPVANHRRILLFLAATFASLLGNVVTSAVSIEWVWLLVPVLMLVLGVELWLTLQEGKGATPVLAGLSRRNFWVAAASLGGLTILTSLLILYLQPTDSRIGWLAQYKAQQQCQDPQIACILVARLTGQGPISTQVTLRVTESLYQILERQETTPQFEIVTLPPMTRPRAARQRARTFTAPLIVWGIVTGVNDVQAEIHLELVDRLAIAQGADLDPFRLQHLPVDQSALVVDISCATERECLDPTMGQPARQAPLVAQLAQGLTAYSLRQTDLARQTLQPLAEQALLQEKCDNENPDLVDCLADVPRSLLLYYAGRLAGFQGDYAAALTYLNPSANLNPQDPALSIAVGYIYDQWGGNGFTPQETDQAYARAQRLLDEVCDNPSDQKDAGQRLYDLGVMAEIQKEWPTAVTCYAAAAAALTSQGEDPYSILINLARVQRLAGQGDAAAQMLERARSKAPDLPWAYLELAQLTAATDPDLARDYLAQAQKLDGRLSQIFSTRAELCADWGDAACAEDAYEEAITLSSDSVWLHQKAAEFYREQGKFSQAEAHLQQAIALGAHNPWVYEQLGYVLYAQEDWDGAAKNYAMAVDPTVGYSLESVGNLFCLWSISLSRSGQDNGAALADCKRYATDEATRNLAIQVGQNP